VALAMHPSGQYVATADRHLRPAVWVWDATSGNPVCCFQVRLLFACGVLVVFWSLLFLFLSGRRPAFVV
jgi:hypothetical protein